MAKKRILLVEGQEALRNVLVSLLLSYDFNVEGVASAHEALVALSERSFDCILCDMGTSISVTLNLMSEIKDNSVEVPVVVLAGRPTIEEVVDLMRAGAADLLRKPVEPEVLATRLASAITEFGNKENASSIRSSPRGEIITNNPIVIDIMRDIERVARVDSQVLLLGESGTGKEILARRIHNLSPRKDKRFIAINCAAIPPELLESELFGHEQGAFTGAESLKLGVFELGSEGTILLDEIGDMPLALQVKLLRTLQEGEIKRVGGTRTIEVHPRIISATNHDIEAAIAKRTLREDLYYRLAVITIKIPPLRSRPEDIEPLVSYYLQHFCNKFTRAMPHISHDVWSYLQAYAWPGNVRELQNMMERVAILSGEEVHLNHLGTNLGLDLKLFEEARVSLTAVANAAARRAETEMIEHALRLADGNKSVASRNLGVSYKTLLNKIKEYGLVSG